MVNIELIKKRGGDSKSLKAKFNKTNIEAGGKIEELVRLTAGRINDGLQGNFRDAKIWWAIDRAYDINQRQVPYTLVSGFLDSRPSKSTDVYKAAADWGIDKLLTPLCNSDGSAKCDAAGTPMMKLDLPTFFQIYVPVVQAYHKIRVAKLFGDRDRDPLYNYEPLRLTMQDRLKCEIVTARVQRQATDMGYRSDERQSIHQATLYGNCLNFPMEDWWTEKQLDGKGEERVIREGIRNAIPHPARTFYDYGHRLSTLNSDTGVQWAGYWDIVRWGEMLGQKEYYWNLDKVGATYGKYSWLKSDGWRIYQELFPCRFPFPNLSERQGAGEQDRIERANYYLTEDHDNGVVQACIFQKLVPSDWGLYDYKYPVWHRCVMAAEDTMIWCSPLGYNPSVAYMYDHDQGRAFNSSLGLELMPWQDMMSNYLTQLLISVKQNLASVVFWNKDLLDDKYVELIDNLGEKLYRKTNFIPFSRQEWSWQKQTERDVFHRVEMPSHNTQEVLMAINTMLMVMERMLGYTPEEVGGRSSAEESATAAGIRETHRGIRIGFTGSFIDEARHARKRQLYQSGMNYWDDEIFAEVAEMNDAKEADLKKMGFEIEYPAKGDHTKAGVKGDKASLTLDGFAFERDTSSHMPDNQVAAAMIQTFQAIFANPAMVEQIGVPQLIDLFNQMLVYAGLPKDFRLKLDSTKKSPVQEQTEVIQGLQTQVAEAIKATQLQAAESDAKIVQGTQQEMQQLAQASAQAMDQKLTELATGVNQMVDGKVGELAQGIQQAFNPKMMQMGQALMGLIQRLPKVERENAMQDAAIQKLFNLFGAAAGLPPGVGPTTGPAPATVVPQPQTITA